MDTVDTIAAICTGLGGAISIIRISGDQALEVASQVWHGKEKLAQANARMMMLGRITGKNTDPGDPALAVFMPGPNSYTGENIVELHCHGGTMATRKALNSVLASGARLAEPGEFTYRAFINGKMDLTQAEAVADIISAHSEMALNLAERQVRGALTDIIEKQRDELIEILAECESRMDFTEEDLDWTENETYLNKINTITAALNELAATGHEGQILRNGIRVVLAGKPNAGKSSLLNLLLGYERAIVTQLPGTTRDTLEETANLRNIPVKLTDTAGIREATDLIEGMGIDRSRQSIKQAQIVFWLLDATAVDLDAEVNEMLIHATGQEMIAVWNKMDIAGDKTKLPVLKVPTAFISVEKRDGISRLLDLFEQAVWGYPHTEEPEVAVSSRHAALLREAIAAMPGAAATLQDGEFELAAVHLRGAITALGSITGETADPDILETIFSRFCIGK